MNERVDIKRRILALKQKLKATDYKAIKYAEGLISDEEYETVRQERIRVREQISELEEALK